MNNINIASADDLAALVAANPRCKSPFSAPSPIHSAGKQMQNGIVVHVSTMETDEQIASRMAEIILDGCFAGNPITEQDLGGYFSEAEIQVCTKRAMIIVRSAVSKLAAKGIRRARVKAGSSRTAPPRQSHQVQTATQ